MENHLPSTFPVLPVPPEKGYIELEATGDFVKTQPHFLHLVLVQEVTKL